jgi:hypothetical protein
MLVRMTVRNISWLAAIAAVVALSIGAAPAASAGTGPLLAELGNLGLSVYDNGGVLAAEGPAATVDKACTTLGTKDGYGAVAAYTGTDETGTGFVLFPGDHVRHGSEYGVDGVTEVNFQNCTDQPWEVGEPDHAPVDQQAPGTDSNTRPQDWAAQEGRSRLLGNP